jgi:hypothetical protein
MEQVTAVTGRRHIGSTPRSRAAARTRAAKLGRFEQRAIKATQGAAIRIESSKLWPVAVATALFVFGSVEPK